MQMHVRGMAGKVRCTKKWDVSQTVTWKKGPTFFFSDLIINFAWDRNAPKNSPTVGDASALAIDSCTHRLTLMLCVCVLETNPCALRSRTIVSGGFCFCHVRGKTVARVAGAPWGCWRECLLKMFVDQLLANCVSRAKPSDTQQDKMVLHLKKGCYCPLRTLTSPFTAILF